METLNASDAKREFGEMLLKAQHAPVSIHKNGKPVAVVMSAQEFASLEVMKEAWLRSEIQKGMEDFHAGRSADGAEVMRRMMERLR